MAGSRSREGGRPGEDPGLSHEQWEPWMVFEQERHALFGMFQGTSADLSSVLSSSRWDGETQAGRSPGTLGGSTGSGLLRGDGGKAELQQVKKGRGVIRAEEMQVLWQWGQHPVLGKPGGPWGSGGPRQQEARHEGCECCWGHWLSPEGSQIHTSNREADCWRRGGVQLRGQWAPSAGAQGQVASYERMQSPPPLPPSPAQAVFRHAWGARETVNPSLASPA